MKTIMKLLGMMCLVIFSTLVLLLTVSLAIETMQESINNKYIEYKHDSLSLELTKCDSIMNNSSQYSEEYRVANITKRIVIHQLVTLTTNQVSPSGK